MSGEPAYVLASPNTVVPVSTIPASLKIMLMKAFFVQQADGRIIETVIRAESPEKARTYVPSDVTLHETNGDVITALGWPDAEGRYDGEFCRID